MKPTKQKHIFTHNKKQLHTFTIKQTNKKKMNNMEIRKNLPKYIHTYIYENINCVSF